MKPSELLARIDERQDHIDQQLVLILEQTQKTNGRVTVLEQWRSRVGGIWFTVGLVFGGVGTVTGIVIGILSLIK